MTNSNPPLKVFIGSSTEGLEIAKNLQAEIETSPEFEAHRWDNGTFTPGSFTLEALIEKAQMVDFAILVATGEDTVTARGMETKAIRDNIVFEFGLFLGALGRERVFLLSVGDVKIPTDLSGLTRLVFKDRTDGDIRSGLNSAVLNAHGAMKRLGHRKIRILPDRKVDAAVTVEQVAHQALAPEGIASRSSPTEKFGAEASTNELVSNSRANAHKDHVIKGLEEEIMWLCSNAEDQGWSVVKSNPTMLRLRSPKGEEFTLFRKRPASTRIELRKFVAVLRANGLRISQGLQGTVEDSPFG